jgi:hypothetical protein
MTDYKKLSEALQTIQDECLKNRDCEKCPFSMVKHGNSDMGAYELANHICAIKANLPSAWQIKPVGFIRQESYSQEIVVSEELTKKQAEAILIILNNEDGVFDD